MDAVVNVAQVLENVEVNTIEAMQARDWETIENDIISCWQGTGEILHPLPKSQRRPPESEESPRADSTKLFLHPEDDEDRTEEVGEDPLDPLA